MFYTILYTIYPKSKHIFVIILSKMFFDIGFLKFFFCIKVLFVFEIHPKLPKLQITKICKCISINNRFFKVEMNYCYTRIGID